MSKNHYLTLLYFHQVWSTSSLLSALPYSHDKKDIHWHPQQRTILDKYHIHTLYMPCTRKKKPTAEDFRYTLFSSALVVDLHVLVVLFTTLFLTAVRTILFRGGGGGGTHGRPEGTELGRRNETKQNKSSRENPAAAARRSGRWGSAQFRGIQWRCRLHSSNFLDVESTESWKSEYCLVGHG